MRKRKSAKEAEDGKGSPGRGFGRPGVMIELGMKTALYRDVEWTLNVGNGEAMVVGS